MTQGFFRRSQRHGPKVRSDQKAMGGARTVGIVFRAPLTVERAVLRWDSVDIEECVGVTEDEREQDRSRDDRSPGNPTTTCRQYYKSIHLCNGRTSHTLPIV